MPEKVERTITPGAISCNEKLGKIGTDDGCFGFGGVENVFNGEYGPDVQ